MTPTPTTISPNQNNNNSKETVALTRSSMNPFHGKAQMIHSILMGSTTSGMSSNKSTETFSGPIESPHGNYNKLTSRPGPSGPTSTHRRTWSFTSPLIEGTPLEATHPPPTSSPRYMPIGTESYTPHIWGYNIPTYIPELQRNSASYGGTSYDWPAYRETAPTWMVPLMNPFEGFIHNERTFGKGFRASQNAEDFFEYPQPMTNSLPNP